MTADSRPEPGLPTAAAMLERIDKLSTEPGIDSRIPALAYTVELAKAHALLGIGRELAAIHDQLCSLEHVLRLAHGLEVPE